MSTEFNELLPVPHGDKAQVWIVAPYLEYKSNGWSDRHSRALSSNRQNL
jgi:hypothetical protein